MMLVKFINFSDKPMEEVVIGIPPWRLFYPDAMNSGVCSREAT